MENRRRLSRHIEKDVLTASRRRCCLCVYLNNREGARKGQIAHLNHKRNDSRFKNLVFLCLEHHDDYDGRTSQSKGYLPSEVRVYRNRLYEKLKNLDKATRKTRKRAIQPKTSQYKKLRKRIPQKLHFLARPWRYPLWQIANQPELFAYKAGNGMDGVCLIERIDLPDGRIVIACIQATGNPGQSITNCVEKLCLQVCDRFEISAERLVWLEHYDHYGPQDWKLVTFAKCPPDSPFAEPTWTQMTLEMWRELKLHPKKKLKQRFGQFESKLKKLFYWPKEAIL